MRARADRQSVVVLFSSHVAGTNSGIQLAHYFGHGLAVELGILCFTSEKRV
jgi:hypothetical protein